MKKGFIIAGNHVTKFLDVFYHPSIRKFINRETYYYIATGGVNTVLDIFLYFIFYRYIFDKQIVDFGFIAISPYIAAFIFVFPITFSTGFLLAKYVTFTKSKLHGAKQLLRYAISVGGSIILNYILLKIFIEHFLILPTLSKIMTTVFVVIYSFIIQKFFTFKTGTKLKYKSPAKGH
ncbi:MAG: hypothetical protein AUJ98_07625 [Bacteroidetes bacterium CG2_30_33_31]|nr:MAG: hypothetical protein AUJ98_07625 [Bacteroidetes bacterium CG2_30_33_31]